MKKIKNTTSIVIEMTNLPHYAPLKDFMYYKEFLLLMAPKHQRHIAKILIKNDTLSIITLNHIGYQELNHDDNKNYIKVLIKIYAKENPQSKFSQVKNLKIFSQARKINQEKQKQNLEKEKKHMRPYIELSSGKFKNYFEDKTLYDKFEELRESIKKND